MKPEDIHHDDGRWIHRPTGEDVTAKLFWWDCPKCKSSYEETIDNKVQGVGCPVCVDTMTDFGGMRE